MRKIVEQEPRYGRNSSTDNWWAQFQSHENSALDSIHLCRFVLRICPEMKESRLGNYAPI